MFLELTIKPNKKGEKRGIGNSRLCFPLNNTIISETSEGEAEVVFDGEVLVATEPYDNIRHAIQVLQGKPVSVGDLIASATCHKCGAFNAESWREIDQNGKGVILCPYCYHKWMYSDDKLIDPSDFVRDGGESAPAPVDEVERFFGTDGEVKEDA